MAAILGWKNLGVEMQHYYLITLAMVGITLFCDKALADPEPPAMAGSEYSLADAVRKSTLIFVGRVVRIDGPAPIWPNKASYSVFVDPGGDVLKGRLEKKTINLGVDVGGPKGSKNEEPPAKDHRYVFFVVEHAKSTGTLKLLPCDEATLMAIKERIAVNEPARKGDRVRRQGGQVQ